MTRSTAMTRSPGKVTPSLSAMPPGISPRTLATLPMSMPSPLGPLLTCSSRQRSNGTGEKLRAMAASSGTELR